MPTLTFKVSLDEARRIRMLAKQKKTTVSDYVRQRSLQNGKTHEQVRRIRCKHTGAMIFASPAGTVPLTTERVREMLADFP